mgnify:CR=1 FL=1
MTKFKIGEKVVCIDNTNYYKRLTIYKIYNIKFLIKSPVSDTYKFYIICDDNIECEFYDWRFITLQEYRELKIKNLFK